MFNLFRKKQPSIKIIDKVWMNESYKEKAIIREWKKNRDTVFVFWFEETLERIQIGLAKETTEPTKLYSAREVSSVHIGSNPLIFAEHYPLTDKENILFQKLGLKEVVVWSALNEPLFQLFGGEGIIELMKKMGINEEEVIEHNMISKSIRNAQKKIAAKVSFDQSARSQNDWFQKNLTG